MADIYVPDWAKGTQYDIPGTTTYTPTTSSFISQMGYTPPAGQTYGSSPTPTSSTPTYSGGGTAAVAAPTPPSPEPLWKTGGTQGTEADPYIQYAGSPDIFDKATGQRLTEKQADKAGIFGPDGKLLKVQVLATPRPEIRTESDFSKYTEAMRQSNTIPSVTPVAMVEPFSYKKISQEQANALDAKWAKELARIQAMGTDALSGDLPSVELTEEDIATMSSNDYVMTGGKILRVPDGMNKEQYMSELRHSWDQWATDWTEERKARESAQIEIDNRTAVEQVARQLGLSAPIVAVLVDTDPGVKMSYDAALEYLQSKTAIIPKEFYTRNPEADTSNPDTTRVEDSVIPEWDENTLSKIIENLGLNKDYKAYADLENEKADATNFWTTKKDELASNRNYPQWLIDRRDKYLSDRQLRVENMYTAKLAAMDKYIARKEKLAETTYNAVKDAYTFAVDREKEIHTRIREAKQDDRDMYKTISEQLQATGKNWADLTESQRAQFRAQMSDPTLLSMLESANFKDAYKRAQIAALGAKSISGSVAYAQDVSKWSPEMKKEQAWAWLAANRGQYDLADLMTQLGQMGINLDKYEVEAFAVPDGGDSTGNGIAIWDYFEAVRASAGKTGTIGGANTIQKADIKSGVAQLLIEAVRRNPTNPKAFTMNDMIGVITQDLTITQKKTLTDEDKRVIAEAVTEFWKENNNDPMMVARGMFQPDKYTNIGQTLPWYNPVRWAGEAIAGTAKVADYGIRNAWSWINAEPNTTPRTTENIDLSKFKGLDTGEEVYDPFK